MNDDTECDEDKLFFSLEKSSHLIHLSSSPELLYLFSSSVIVPVAAPSIHDDID